MASKTNKHKLLGEAEVYTFFISFVHIKKVLKWDQSQNQHLENSVEFRHKNLCSSSREIDKICSHREKKYPDHMQKKMI